MYRLRAYWLAGFSLVILVGGCAQLTIFGADRERGNIDAFETLGRVYVRYGARAFTGTLRWRHDSHIDEVWLGGPLGQTAAYIVRNENGASLTAADQRTYHATSMEALTRKGLGWTLPLADLSYYVVGKLPPDAAEAAERDAQGRLVRARHDGWDVRWTYAEAAPLEAMLPRLNLVKDDIEIRFVVDRLDRNTQASLQ
jgi:outer membrane lipoprotein LolB